MPKNDEEESIPPWNFSWVVENQLAAMGWPYSVANLRFIVSQGIKHLITLSPEKLPPILKFQKIKWTEIPIEEFEAPTLDQIVKFIQICENCLAKNEAIGIHCRQGRGRTGVMAACFLVRFQDLAPERAIINLRLQRPGSIETLDQERSVWQYHDYLRKKGMQLRIPATLRAATGYMGLETEVSLPTKPLERPPRCSLGDDWVNPKLFCSEKNGLGAEIR